MLAKQNGVCAVCREVPPTNVDHDHKTGRKRGLLCWPCNVAVGQLKDDPDRAIRLAQYLRQSIDGQEYLELLDSSNP